MLWEVITRSRASDSAGPDCVLKPNSRYAMLIQISSTNPGSGLAAHLAVPLPYLLFRAQTRYEEDLRGLQLHTALGSAPPLPLKSPDDEYRQERPDLARRISGRTAAGSTKLSSSSRATTPLAVRARLNSLGYESKQRFPKASSSSVATLQNIHGHPLAASRLPTSSGSDTDSEDEAVKNDEEERRLEEQKELDKKLEQLKAQMTNDAIGLVRDERIAASQSKGKQYLRGRNPRSPTSPLRNAFQRDPSSSDLNSSTSSPQGSIPSIPSPSESQSQLFAGRQVTRPTKSSSPPVLSPSQARSQPMQYRPMAIDIAQASDRSSTQGSSASSFSDISGWFVSRNVHHVFSLFWPDRIYQPVGVSIRKCVDVQSARDRRFAFVSHGHVHFIEGSSSINLIYKRKGRPSPAVNSADGHQACSNSWHVA